MHAIARVITLILCLVAQDSWAGVVLFQKLTDTIRLSSPTTLGTAATLEARILFTSTFNGGQDLYREWVDSVEDKHLAVSPTGVAIELHDVGATLSTPTTVGLNTWHHIAAVYDGASVSLYLDGVRVATESASGSIANGSALPIFGGGQFETSTTIGFIGYVDWFRMSNTARYGGASFTPPSSQPATDSNTVLLFYFDESSGSATAADQSSNRNNGTLGVGAAGATSPVFTSDPLAATNVPTVSDSLLIVLAAALAVTGGIAVRRRLTRISA
jgi:hypothetical protein